MKMNFKSALLGLALIVSVTGAFASQISNIFTTSTVVNYHWQHLDRDGNLIEEMNNTSSISPYPTCPGGSTAICARGQVVGQPYTLFTKYP